MAAAWAAAALAAGLSGCAGLMADRTFIDKMGGGTPGFFRPGRDFPVLAGDTGRTAPSRRDVLGRIPSGYRGEEAHELREELEGMERRLSPAGRRLYEGAGRLLANDSERIYFLSLPPRERRLYLASKDGRWAARLPAARPAGARPPGAPGRPGGRGGPRGFRGVAEEWAPVHRRRPIEPGMSMDDVRGRWGEPRSVAVAGRRRDGNERWLFRHGDRISYVYFEGGLVQGWSAR